MIKHPSLSGRSPATRGSDIAILGGSHGRPSRPACRIFTISNCWDQRSFDTLKPGRQRQTVIERNHCMPQFGTGRSRTGRFWRKPERSGRSRYDRWLRRLTPNAAVSIFHEQARMLQALGRFSEPIGLHARLTSVIMRSS